MWSLEGVSDLHQKKEKQKALLAAQVHWRELCEKEGEGKKQGI